MLLTRTRSNVRITYTARSMWSTKFFNGKDPIRFKAQMKRQHFLVDFSCHSGLVCHGDIDILSHDLKVEQKSQQTPGVEGIWCGLESVGE